jgi:lipopolysaccharide export system protein LptA
LTIENKLNKLFHILQIALFLGAIFLTPTLAWGQREILELLPGAEKLSYNEKTGAQRLVGKVNFIYQGNTMYCDSAHFYHKTNEVRAYGKVHINKDDTLNLYCDSLYYNGKSRKAKLWGHVRVRDREYKLSSDSLEYDAKKGQATYRNGGKIENIQRKEVLTSKVGYLYPDSKNLFFSGNVVYKSDSLKMTTDTLRYQYLAKKVYFYGPTKIVTNTAEIICSKGWYHTETEEGVLQKNAFIQKEGKNLRGDSLYVNPAKGISIGKGNVFYSDTASPLSFQGTHYYASDSKKFGYLTGKTLCSYKLKDDTLHIHADSIFTFQDSVNELKTVLAYKQVKLFSTNFQGVCDSLSYAKDSSRIEMYRSPIVWSKNAELKGDFIQAFVRDSILDYVDILGKSTSVMEVDSGNFYNQIGGKNMKAFFLENELRKVTVRGNAQTVYYPEETTENDTLVEIKRSGMSRLYASDLTVKLDSGEVKSVTYLEQPDGIFYPMNQLNASEKFVQGFSWNPALRPKSLDEIVNE